MFNSLQGGFAIKRTFLTIIKINTRYQPNAINLYGTMIFSITKYYQFDLNLLVNSLLILNKKTLSAY